MVNPTDYVKEVVEQAGVPSHETASFEENEHGLSVTYRTVSGDWIKILPPTRSNGGYLIKPLRAPQREERSQNRYLVMPWFSKGVNAAANRTFLPECLLFDERKEVYKIQIPFGDDVPPTLAGRTIVYLKNIEGAPLDCQSENIWSPTEYPVETIRSCITALWELQKLGDQWLEENLVRASRLSHEDRELMGYDRVFETVTDSLGISSFSKEEIIGQGEALLAALKKRTEEQSEQIKISTAAIARKLDLPEESPSDELAEAFLEKQSPHYTSARESYEKKWKDVIFPRELFCAEREKLWPEETLHLGKEIAQLQIAEELAQDILENKAALTLKLLKNLCELEGHYRQVDLFPKGVVHQDGHPAQFVKLPDDQIAIVDIFNISVDVCFADLANNYLYKFVRSYHNEQITEVRALDYIKALLIPEWVGDHGEHLLSYNVASLWNHITSITDSYNLEQGAVEDINLAVTLERFSRELDSRLKYEQTYRQKLFPKIPSHR